MALDFVSAFGFRPSNFLIMTSRERILTACAHRQPDKLPVDFGGGFQTGIHVSMVYKLRQALGLDRPGTPVKVVEIYQMLGEVAPDLQAALGVDAVSLHGTGTMFGFPQTEFKEWQLADGTPVLVPKDFNTQYEPNGDLLQWPGNDRPCLPAAACPRAAISSTPSSARRRWTRRSWTPRTTPRNSSPSPTPNSSTTAASPSTSPRPRTRRCSALSAG